MIVGVAIPDFGTVDLLSFSQKGWTGIFSGGALIFFSYSGFEDLVKLAEEIREPRRNLSKPSC